MTEKIKTPPIWQLPALIASGPGLLGLLGTWAVGYATYAELPKKVEKVEEKNDSQDTAIDKLTALQEFYAEQKQAPNQIYRRPEIIREKDSDGVWWCCSESDSDICYLENLWQRC